MADEILNKLGFDVSQALTALQSLDNSLAKNQLAFQNSYSSLATWNAQAQVTLSLMRDMASAAAGVKIPKVSMAAIAPTAPAAGAATWPPADLESRIQQAIGLTNKFGGAVSVAGDKVRVSGMRGAQAIDQMNNSAKRFTISWQMVSRIVITQAIVRALSAIRNMLRDIVSNSIEFQRSLAEIQAITPKIHGDFVSLGDEAATLSKRFNIPLPQVTEALYQSISNQFVTVSDRTRIMEASMKLARVGCMELDDAVLLLTGTLNAYGIGAENAEVTAAKFFKTIQLGRVRGKELADTIGTVIPFAAQLGVSLDEVAASYVSMTISGLDAHKTATGLRQAMVAMLKPSEDMKKVVRELGFGSPEQLVQARGLIGAMQAISEAANGMGSEVVKSVRNVRALTAQLSLTRNDSEEVIRAFEEIGKVGGDSLQALYDEFIKMPAERLTKEINALSVTLTQDLGEALTGVLADLIAFFGGADKMSAALQSLVLTLGYAGAAVLTFAAAWGVLHLAMGPVGWALAAVSVGLTALIATSAYQSIRAVQDIKAVAEARRQAAYEEVKVKEEALRKVREAENKEMKASLKAWEEKAAGLRKDFFKAMDELQLKNTQLIDNTRETLSSMISSQERVATAYKSAAKAAADAVQQSRERQISAEAAYSDAVFKYVTKNKDAYQQVEAYMSRARMLAKEAEDAMRGAKTPDQIAAAQAIFQRAEAAASEAEQIANGTKNTQLQQDAQRQVLFVMRQKIEAEKSLQELQATEAKRLADKAAVEQRRLNDMKVLMKAILEDLKAFDKEGAREPKALAEQQQRLQENVAKFRELALTGQEVSIADFLGLDQLQQRIALAIESGTSDVQLRRFYGTPEAFARLRRDIEDGVGPVKILIKAAAQSSPELKKAMQDLTAEGSLALISEEMSRSAQALAKFKEVRDKLTIARTEMEQARTQASQSLDDFRRGIQELPRSFKFKLATKLMGDEFTTAAAAVERKFLAEASQLVQPDAVIDEAALKRLGDAWDQYVKTFQPSAATMQLLQEFAANAKAVASRSETITIMEKGLPEITNRMRESQRLIQEANRAINEAQRAAREAQQSSQGADTAARGAYISTSHVASIDMGRYTSQVQSAASAMWNLANAAAAVRTPVAPEFAAFGGRAGRYLAAGGPVGTDVIPTWLSQGEFVMNAGAASKFASQLVAMNAGVQPVFRSEGGGVTNIGDINVSVVGGGTGRQTARDIAAELRRELRRGTTTL